MIVLTANNLTELEQHAKRDYPYECCGLLLGQFGEEAKTVVEIFPISNAREEEAKRNRFLIHPEELRRGENYAEGRALAVIGFYHSHPDHPAIPSQYDLEHAWPIYSYIILSVENAQVVDIRSWELEFDRSRFNEEALEGRKVAKAPILSVGK